MCLRAFQRFYEARVAHVAWGTQVYTAEEKAALAMFNMEENKRKEQKILADMQRLVQRTLGETEEAPEEDAAEEAS